MENKKQLTILSLISTGAIVLIGLFLAYWIYANIISVEPSEKDIRSAHIGIDIESYDKISSPNTYGSKVELHEPGTGRDNPFEKY